MQKNAAARTVCRCRFFVVTVINPVRLFQKPDRNMLRIICGGKIALS